MAVVVVVFALVVVVVAGTVVVVPASVVVVVPARVVVVVTAPTVVVVVFTLAMIEEDIAFTVVCDGGAGVTPLGSKAKVTRRYCANLIEPGLVVMTGLVWESDVQYAYST